MDWERVLETLGRVAGTFGLSYRHLGTGEEFAHNPDGLFYACSVIKVPIMAEVFRQAEKGLLHLGRPVPIARHDQVGGSGVLQYLTPGTELSVLDLITLMIVVSDNTATNLLLDIIGLDATTAFMRELGLPNIRVYHKLQVVAADRQDVNVISPGDMTRLMTLLSQNKVVSMHASIQMIRILKQQQFNEHLTKYLPLEPAEHRATGALPPIEVAHKNGWIGGVRHETGLFYLPGQEYVLTVCTKDAKDDRAADEAIAQVGRMVYERVSAGKAAG